MDFIRFKSILELVKTLDTEQKCIDYLTTRRWHGKVVSPFDSTSSVYVCKGNKYKCRNTNKYFNVRTGTMFDDTKLPLQKWFMAIYLIASHKKGISSYQIARDLSITQKSAWFMLHRIRYSFATPEFQEKLNNTVEIDEMFSGGKGQNMHESKRKQLKRTGAGYSNLTPVLGMVERGGNIKAMKVSNLSKNTLIPIIKENVSTDATIITDGNPSYIALKHDFKQHKGVEHTISKQSFGQWHTNNIEGFWSMFKRGVIGIYHQVSPKYINQYLNEFSYRYNTREFTEFDRFELLLSNIADKQLRYNKLVNKEYE
jgi:transposase-like protein